MLEDGVELVVALKLHAFDGRIENGAGAVVEVDDEFAGGDGHQADLLDLPHLQASDGDEALGVDARGIGEIGDVADAVVGIEAGLLRRREKEDGDGDTGHHHQTGAKSILGVVHGWGSTTSFEGAPSVFETTTTAKFNPLGSAQEIEIQSPGWSPKD